MRNAVVLQQQNEQANKKTYQQERQKNQERRQNELERTNAPKTTLVES